MGMEAGENDIKVMMALPGRMEMGVPGGEEVVEDKLLDILHIPPVATIALLEQGGDSFHVPGG